MDNKSEARRFECHLILQLVGTILAAIGYVGESLKEECGGCC